MRILCVTYAFPPLDVPMAMVVYKNLIALKNLGISVDIITVDSKIISSFVQNTFIVDDHFDSLLRLTEIDNSPAFLKKLTDPMFIFNKNLLNYLIDKDLSQYEAVISFSPFHSINLVLAALKKIKKFKWIAHFCDPWFMNPIEHNVLKKYGSYYFEKKVVKSCDYLIHTSQQSLDLMLKHDPFKRSKVLPHVFIRELYPKRLKNKNKKLTIRHIGTIIRERTPSVLLKALDNLQLIFPNIMDLINIEFIGNIDSIAKLEISKHSSLIHVKKPISYIESLQYMYDSDILLLLEGAADKSLFMPSKLADYIGANSQIIGICPQGASRDFLLTMNMACVYDSEVNKLTNILKEAIVNFHEGKIIKIENNNSELEASYGAKKYKDVIEAL